MSSKNRADSTGRKKNNFLKQATFTLLIVFLFFLSLEILLYFLSPLYKDEKIALTSSYDPEKRALIINKGKESQIANTVLFNIKHNQLTFPDTELIFRVKHNASGKTVIGYSGINSIGFRGREFSPRSKQKNKIMILGGSCSFGWHIKDYLNTFPYLLETKLNEESSSENEIYNFSQPGYSTTQGLILFKKWFDKINPDVLILYFGWNDIWPSPMLTDKQTIALLKVSTNPVIRFVKKLSTYSFIVFLVKKTEVVNTGQKDAKREIRESGIRVPVKETLSNFDKIIDHSKQNKTDVIVILPPFSNREYVGLKGIIKYNKIVRKHLKDRVTFLDLEMMRHDKTLSYTYFNKDGFHPNELGARYIADELFRTFENM